MATNHSPLTYTQETLFEQAIGGPIAALWQTRQEGFVKGTEKKNIYWCKLTNPEHKKAVLIVNGRIESSWKYQELFYDLYRQGFDVYSFDHRGQGLSDRLLSDSDMGHVYDFTDYIDDMDIVVKKHDLSEYQQCFIIAHSMGGAIATRYLQTHPEHPFTGLILSAPMFGINLPWYLSPIAIPVTQIMSAVSTLPRYAPRTTTLRASLPVAIRSHKARTTARSALPILMAVTVWKSISTPVWRLASTWKASTPRSLLVSGNSRFSPRVQKRRVTRFGLLAICWNGLARPMGTPLSGTPSILNVYCCILSHPL